MFETTELPGRQRKSGLRVAQLRILKLLCETKGLLTKQKIAEKLDEPSTAWMSAPLGLFNEELRGGREEREGYPSLLTLGYVECIILDIDGLTERTYQVTDAGRRASVEASEG
jgi:hypothetical protein